MRNSESRFCQAGIKTGGFTAKRLTLKKTKHNKIKETFPTGGTSYLENIISKLRIKVKVMAWWIILQGSRKLFGKPSARPARAVCAPSAPWLLRCPLVSRGAAFTWEKPDRAGHEALTHVMPNTREVGPGGGCPHRGCPHRRSGAPGLTRLFPEGRQSRAELCPRRRAEPAPRPQAASGCS